MTNIGRITGSAASATNENNFSLININADFSLLKVEAPAEYQGLGAALSSCRRENAESGPLHRTARKLGALFEQILPPIKALAEAYGKRVSEISASEKLKGTGIAQNSPFASHVGFDGTSIYAAATSGHSAIAVHFLACMLARTWSGSEATALWVELVAERKRDIERNTEASQIQGIAARVAAQQEISRVELAKWDASARAWLLSADEVKIWERTQLRLITKNCGMLVGLQGSTYASVLDVWTVAMTSVQKLILGMPQRISKAALLIGISSWHIYPDLNVVGPTVNVKFHDALVSAGGVLTLGLQSASPNNDDGVHWSLSLSHLRFYGDPVLLCSRADVNDLRITMEDLHIITLGGILGSWGDEPGGDVAGAKWLAALRDCYNRGAPSEMCRRLPSLDLLCRTAERFIAPGPPTQKENDQFLLSYGKRKARRFLNIGESGISLPLFGFLDRPFLARLSTEFSNTHDSDSVMIDKLRDFARRCDICPMEGYILRYRSDCQLELPFASRIEITTPILGTPQTRYTTCGSDYQHARVTPTVTEFNRKYRRFNDRVLRPKSVLLKRSEFDNLPRLVWPNRPQPNISHNFRQIQRASEELVFFAGDVTKVALFSTQVCLHISSRKPLRKRFASNLTYSEITEFLQSRNAVPWKVRRALNRVLDGPFIEKAQIHQSGLYLDYDLFNARQEMNKLERSLADLLYVTQVYEDVPGATVSIGVINHTLSASRWAIHRQSQWGNTPLSKMHPHRTVDFSAIALFETGTLDIDPTDMSAVMALASGNSIFVANSLLQDPCEPSSRIIRLLGNLGRPGVVMLVPPQLPLIRSLDPKSWRLVNHATFDGKFEASFKDASLHLSFTDYEVPVKVSVGAVDAEATMLETLVSVYDRQQWVADLDVLGSLEESFLCLSTSECLGEGPHESSLSIKDIAAGIKDLSTKQLISIDCWEELLDPPEGLGHSSIAIFRAGDNWNARLAAMCVCVQKGLRTQALPVRRPLCWNCSQSIGSMLNTTDVFIF